jgi:hypothetical protein
MLMHIKVTKKAGVIALGTDFPVEVNNVDFSCSIRQKG